VMLLLLLQNDGVLVKWEIQKKKKPMVSCLFLIPHNTSISARRYEDHFKLTNKTRTCITVAR
jgi:hypothetical protein